MSSDRLDQFMKWFGDTVRINDCDPALYMINYFFDRFEFNQEQKYWLCWLYGTTYNFATAYIIWNEFPDFHLVDSDRLKEWNDKNYKRLRYQTDTKWNKGHLPVMFESYKKWVGNRSQHSKFLDFIGEDPQANYRRLWKEAKSWFKFGRYTTWFYLQTIKHCAGVPLDAEDLILEDYSGSRSHRNGLCYAVEREDCIDKKLDKDMLLRMKVSAKYILQSTQIQHPDLKDKLDYFAMETALCSFKKLFRTTHGRYLGYYHDRQAEEIKKAEGDGWIGINWEPLWQCRAESIPEKYLSGAIDKEKMKLFLAANTTKQIHLIGGLPVTGKTTLMNRIRKKLNNCTQGHHFTLKYEEYENHIIFGIYAGTTFDGTDKLSMAAQPDALDFLKHNTKNVIIEGDRLFNQKFIDGARTLGYDVKITVLYVDKLGEILKRYQKRGQMQSEKFIKGRHTKISNIILNNKHKILDSSGPIPDTEIDLII